MADIGCDPDWDAEFAQMREWSTLMHEHLAEGIDTFLASGLRLALQGEHVDKFTAKCGAEIGWGLIQGVATVKAAAVNVR